MKTPASCAIGVIFGNRDFFPDHLVSEARADIEKLFKELGIEAVMLGAGDSKLGGVETHAEARKCAELFRRNRDRIAGELSGILAFVEQLNEVDTSAVQPMTSVVATRLKTREDVVSVAGDRDALLANAPKAEHGFFVVPKVIE